MAGRLTPFPVTLNQADARFILLAHHVRHADGGICPPCQNAILYHFCILSKRHNTGLQLDPFHLDPQYQTPQEAVRVNHLRNDMLAWQSRDRAAFDDLLHNRWLAMFESAKGIIDAEYKGLQQATASPRQSPPFPLQRRDPVYPLQQRVDAVQYVSALTTSEESLTKIWHACAGRYTTADLLRGRPYTGYPSGFECMHLRRLVVLQKPSNGDLCRCADRAWRLPPGAGLPPQDWLASPPHTEVVMKYTAPLIRDMHGQACRDLIARGQGHQAKSLGKMLQVAKFKDMFVAAVGNVEAEHKERKAREEEERIKVLEAAGTLMMMRAGWGADEKEKTGDTIVVKIEPESD